MDDFANQPDHRQAMVCRTALAFETLTIIALWVLIGTIRQKVLGASRGRKVSPRFFWVTQTGSEDDGKELSWEHRVSGLHGVLCVTSYRLFCFFCRCVAWCQMPKCSAILYYYCKLFPLDHYNYWPSQHAFPMPSAHQTIDPIIR